MTLEEFGAAIQAFAVRDGATEAGITYCEAENFREQWESGATPEEVWQDECDAAADMLG